MPTSVPAGVLTAVLGLLVSLLVGVGPASAADDPDEAIERRSRQLEAEEAERAARRRTGSSAGGTHWVVPASRPVFGRAVFPGRSERTRSTLSYLSGASISSSPLIEPLLRTVRENAPGEDLAVLQRAFAVADERHQGQKRKSGDPYITHPVAVTTILAELGMTGSVLVAALLHDTVEDTDYSLEQLTEEFGEEVAALVDGADRRLGLLGEPALHQEAHHVGQLVVGHLAAPARAVQRCRPVSVLLAVEGAQGEGVLR